MSSDPKRLIIFLLVFWLSIIISPVVFCIEKLVLLCDIEVSSSVPKDNAILSFNWRFPPWINTSPAVFVIPSAVVNASPVTSNPLFASTLPAKVTWEVVPVWVKTPDTSKPASASTLPPKVTCSLPVCVIAWLVIVKGPPVTSKPAPASTLPAKVTWPPVVCVIAWLSIVNAPPAISRPKFAFTLLAKVTWEVFPIWFKSPVTSKPAPASTFPPKMTWPVSWVNVPATLRFSPIPTPPPTVNAPVSVLLDVVVSLIVTTPAVTSNPLFASTLPAKVTWPPVVCVIAWLFIVKGPPAISRPASASTLPAKVTWPPVVCVIAWLVIVNAPPAISRPEFAFTFPPNVTWPDVWLIVLATPKVPPIKTFPPIPTPPSTVNAPLSVSVDVVELFIDVTPFAVTVPRTKRSPVSGSNVKVAPPLLEL